MVCRSFKFSQLAEKPEVFCFALLFAGLVTAPGPAAAGPALDRRTPAYVSARAHQHYMHAVQAWTSSRSGQALESLQVAGVYDRTAVRIRSRAMQLKFARGKGVSRGHLRRLLRRTPSDPQLLRLKGFENWMRGRFLQAQRAFLQAAEAAGQSGNLMLRAVVYRDLSLMQALEVSVESAVASLDKYAGQDSHLSAWRWRLLSWSAHLADTSCGFELDGEHICGIGTFSPAKPSKSHMGMTWRQSLDLGVEALAWSKACRAQTTQSSCRRFEEALQGLVQPLALIARKDEF